MKINLIFGWIWIFAGLFGGMIMGMFFANEQWLGGYSSHPRRLIRLGHIATIMLGILNILFFLSLPAISLSPQLLLYASWGMLIGAVTMPICCVLMAWNRRLTPIFAIPVTSLLVAVGIICKGVLS